MIQSLESISNEEINQLESSFNQYIETNDTVIDNLTNKIENYKTELYKDDNYYSIYIDDNQITLATSYYKDFELIKITTNEIKFNKQNKEIIIDYIINQLEENKTITNLYYGTLPYKDKLILDSIIKKDESLLNEIDKVKNLEYEIKEYAKYINSLELTNLEIIIISMLFLSPWKTVVHASDVDIEVNFIFEHLTYTKGDTIKLSLNIENGHQVDEIKMGINCSNDITSFIDFANNVEVNKSSGFTKELVNEAGNDEGVKLYLQKENELLQRKICSLKLICKNDIEDIISKTAPLFNWQVDDFQSFTLCNSHKQTRSVLLKQTKSSRNF